MQHFGAASAKRTCCWSTSWSLLCGLVSRLQYSCECHAPTETKLVPCEDVYYACMRIIDIRFINVYMYMCMHICIYIYIPCRVRHMCTGVWTSRCKDMGPLTKDVRIQNTRTKLVRLDLCCFPCKVVTIFDRI